MPADYTTLPADLPAPLDDGAADHLPGMAMPALVLDSSQGPVAIADLTAERAVLYIYPHTGVPGELGARVAGLSGQTPAEQTEFAKRMGIHHPVIADPQLRLRAALSLPTFDLNGDTYLCRLTLVAEHGRIVKAFYPVVPPDRHAGEVLAWLGERGPR